MVRLTDRPDMTLDVYRGRKTTMQQQQTTFENIIMKSCQQDFPESVLTLGFQLCQLIRNDEFTERIPSVVFRVMAI